MFALQPKNDFTLCNDHSNKHEYESNNLIDDDEKSFNLAAKSGSAPPNYCNEDNFHKLSSDDKIVTDTKNFSKKKKSKDSKIISDKSNNLLFPASTSEQDQNLRLLDLTSSTNLQLQSLNSVRANLKNLAVNFSGKC